LNHSGWGQLAVKNHAKLITSRSQAGTNNLPVRLKPLTPERFIMTEQGLQRFQTKLPEVINQ
jgi:hypothetical protein